MRIRLFFSALLTCVALAVFILTSCAAPAVKAPEPKRFTVAENPPGSGFSLSGESPQGVFRGGLLFWSPTVSSVQIKNLLIANKETNQKYVQLQKYFSNFLRTEVEPLRAEVETRRQKFSVSKLRSHARVAPLQAQKAATWYEREMESIQSDFSDFNKLRANKVFEAYCDAKILDLATRPLLAKFSFSARPTPSAICESYYKSKYFDGPECASSADGKNYYKCIWNEGVVRTEIGRRLQIRVAERRGGVRTSQPLTLAEFSDLENIRSAFAHEDVPYCAATEVRRNVLAGVRFRVLSSGVILGGLSCGQNSRFEMSYGPGDWTTSLETASPAVLINSIEASANSGQSLEPFRWIDAAASENDARLAARVENFAQKFASFHAVITGCESELNTANDVFFNDGRLVAGQEFLGSCKSQLASSDALPDVIVVDSELEAERIDLAKLEERLSSLKGNSCTVAPSCDLVPQGHARCDFLNAQVRKAAAAEVKGVADVLLTDFALSFEKVSAASSAVVLSINGAAVGVGCVGEDKGSQCPSTVLKPELLSAQPMNAEVTSSGELVLKMSIDTKQMAAAGVPQSIIAQFLRFEQASLELNVTSNSFEGVVPYLSGKAYLKAQSGGELLSEGSVSYLIENTFDRTLGQFCSAQ